MKREDKEIEVEAKAKELSVKRGTTVHGFIVVIDSTEDSEDYAVAYIEEPKRITKLRVADKMVAGAVSAGAILIDACLIKEESDSRIQTDDVLYLTLCNEATASIKLYSNVIKKN